MTDPDETNIEETEHPPETPTTPDHSWVVIGLSGEPQAKAWLTANTPDSILQFMMEAGTRLKAQDAHWGYLAISGAAPRRSLQLPNNQTISSDSFCYDTTMQVVSVLHNELEKKKKANAHWALMPGISEAHWYPIGGGEADTGESA